MSEITNKLYKAFQSRYLLWFANENVDFRLAEIDSILKLFNINMTWIDKPKVDPFWIVELPSEEDAKKIASRSVTLRSIIKLFGAASNITELHNILKSYPAEKFNPYFSPHISFQVKVETFGKTFTMTEKIDKIEWFNYLPAQGPVNLHNPDVTLYYIEYYGLIPRLVPEKPYFLYFGVWLCDGQRELISKYSLKKRKFIGNTSMDAQLSFIMANQALIKEGDLVMDPFVGTGSLLVAAACFGAYVIGTDIDFLMLHGKTRPTRKQDRSKPRKNESVFENLKQYGIEHRYIDVVVGDSSLPLWHEQLKLDSIVTDPPYGIREATERIGSTKDYKISDEHLQNHIPSKVEYGLTQIYADLLDFAVNHLKINGRLVSWIPVYKADYDDSKLPRHPCLRLIGNSEQTLTNHTSRRLLTWEKIAEVRNNSDQPDVPELFPQGFREHYFGHGETRKQRRARLQQELKEKYLNWVQNGGGKESDR